MPKPPPLPPFLAPLRRRRDARTGPPTAPLPPGAPAAGAPAAGERGEGAYGEVALARVLAQRAPVLLLDEPTAALDLRHQELVLRLCRECAAHGDAVAVVLHDLALAAAYAHHVGLLDTGRLTATGPPREVLTPETLTRVYHHPIEVLPHPHTNAHLVLPIRPPRQ